MSVLVTPRDPNPYQELLYERVRSAGCRVRYADGPTPSQTVNVMLAPFMLCWYRILGFRILHIHWVFQFSLPWADQKRWSRQLMQWWLRFYLFTADVVGYQSVWTAHDILPYVQVFNDDVWARDLLIRKSRAIVALSDASKSELHNLGAKNVFVIPFGSYVDPYPVTISKVEARESFGFDPTDVVVTLMGRVERYKGADLLLLAAARLPPTSRIKLMVAGPCTDEEFRGELIRLARDLEDRVVLNLEWVPESELARYLQASDVAAFPFRDITNSSSVILAGSFGLPVVIPDLPLLGDVPKDAAIRYIQEPPGKTDALLEALERVERLTNVEYRYMSESASAWVHSNDWSSVARQMLGVYEVMLNHPL